MAKLGSSVDAIEAPWNSHLPLRETIDLMHERMAAEGAYQGNVLNDSLRLISVTSQLPSPAKQAYFGS